MGFNLIKKALKRPELLHINNLTTFDKGFWGFGVSGTF